MATTYEIIQGLTQAAANAYDGALTEDGDAVSVGLQREEGNPLVDKRVMDGFNVKFYGNMMCLSYMSEVQLKEVYANGFESEIDQRITDISSWLKKEYKKVTGNSVTLTAEGEVDIRAENSSRVRSWITAKKHYRVGGINEDTAIQTPSEDGVKPDWKTFLDQGAWGDKAENDERKE